MTEDIPSDRHKSNPEIDIVKLKERHMALREDFNGLRDLIEEVKSILIAHIQASDSKHAQLLATFNQHDREDAVAHQKMLGMGAQIASLESESKRDPVSFWTAVSGAAVAIGTIVYVIINGKPPSGP